MIKNKLRLKIFAFVLIVLIVTIIAIISIRYLSANKTGIPSKEVRRENLLISTGTTELSISDVAHELLVALSPYSDWDDLFLSEHFKEKYGSRQSIIEDMESIANMSSAVSLEYGDSAIAIYAEKKIDSAKMDESEGITTEYIFRYYLDADGEIEDIILINKQDFYTIDGEPVELSE